MYKKLLLFLPLLGVLLLGGCADPVVFAEVFQLNQEQKLYTAYNLWYDQENKISCLNIQQGRFLPLGTEIEPLGTSSFPEEIRFKDVQTQQEYVISFSDGHRLCSMREYISYTFTTKNREELLADLPPAVSARILHGEVVPGMTPEQVKLAYGPPPAIRTPSESNESWIYWLTPDETLRLVFRAGKVRNVLNLNQR